MMRLLSQSKLHRMRPPVRRVAALDGGSRRLKLLLAESDFGRLRIVREALIDLTAEALVSPDEVRAQVRTVLEGWGNPPLALVLPQHLSISQVIDLPLAPESEVDKLIAEETIKLSGVSESRIVYDFVRTQGTTRDRQQFWVTLSQEGDVRERILRLGVENEDLCEVTTTANALIAAYQASLPLSSRAILVHLGAQTTVVVILVAGQGAFAASFQMGGDFFTRALARCRHEPEETAETLKRQVDLLTGPESVPEFAAAVDGWAAELKRQLAEWFRANPGLGSGSPEFELVASGGGFDQPGLVAYLRQSAGLPLRPWPATSQPEAVSPSKGFEIAFGAAVQALGYSAQPVSLLPEDYRLAWRKRVTRQRVELASFAVLAVCALILALGTWHQASLLGIKQSLLEKVKAGQDSVQFNDSLTADLVAEYETLRPIFARQQNTLDTLKTFALLTQSRSNRSFYYVLIGDQQSYFSVPPALLATNRPAKSNLLGAALEPLRPGSMGWRIPGMAPTNVAPARPGLIAELCVPGEAEGARLVLSELVNGLKQEPLFSKVDLLSEDLRRSLADPKVIVPDRHYVLALDFAANEFQQPVRWKRLVGAPPPKPGRRTARPPWSTPETEGGTPTAAP